MVFFRKKRHFHSKRLFFLENKDLNSIKPIHFRLFIQKIFRQKKVHFDNLAVNINEYKDALHKYCSQQGTQGKPETIRIYTQNQTMVLSSHQLCDKQITHFSFVLKKLDK